VTARQVEQHLDAEHFEQARQLFHDDPHLFEACAFARDRFGTAPVVRLEDFPEDLPGRKHQAFLLPFPEEIGIKRYLLAAVVHGDEAAGGGGSDRVVILFEDYFGKLFTGTFKWQYVAASERFGHPFYLK